MATTSTPQAGKDAGKKPEAINYLMDETNNLSVIFTATVDDTPAQSEAPKPALLKDDSNSQQLKDWIKNCNNRISAVKPVERNVRDTLGETKTALLAHFPPSLHFPISALFDFANRLGKFENLALADKLGLETQTIISGILYLQQLLKEKATTGNTAGKPLAYSRNESEATWNCYRDIITHCHRNQVFNITLDSEHSTYLPVPTLDIRLIIQNVMYSVLNGSFSAAPVNVHISNKTSLNGARNAFCLSVVVPGNPLGNVISTSFYSSRKNHNTFVFEGSGIGHIIASKLLEFLAGEIVITDNRDQTNTISIMIPLDRTTASSEPLLPVITQQKPRSPHEFSVLYIEDMQSHALLVKQIVDRLANTELLLAATAEKGLELARSLKPDLILLDMDLPDMTGLDAFRLLLENPATATIPVIAISAAAMPHQISQALKLGIKHYLTKPFSYKELILMLQEEQNCKARLQAPE